MSRIRRQRNHLQRGNTKVRDRGRNTKVVRGPQQVLPITPRSKNAMDRDSGRRRPVVSIRLEPKMLEVLERVARSRPYGWSKEPTPRSMLIEEALKEWAIKNDKTFASEYKARTGVWP